MADKALKTHDQEQRRAGSCSAEQGTGGEGHLCFLVASPQGPADPMPQQASHPVPLAPPPPGLCAGLGARKGHFGGFQDLLAAQKQESSP